MKRGNGRKKSNQLIFEDKKSNDFFNRLRKNVHRENYGAVADACLREMRRKDISVEEKSQMMDDIYKIVIATWFRDPLKIKESIPDKYEDLLIEYVRFTRERIEYEKDKNGQYNQENKDRDKSLEILDRIKDSNNPKIRKKVRRQQNLMSLTQELLKDEESINPEVVEQILEEINEEKDNRTYMEVLTSLFGKEFSIDQLDLGELETYLGGTQREIGDGSESQEKKYPEDIQVANRIKFFREELDVEPTVRFCEEGIFGGSILLNIKDSDIVIVEKLFEIYKDGTYRLANQSSSKSAATYVLPKDKVMDMIKYETKKRVKQQLDNDDIREWKPPVSHSKNWKTRVLTAVKNEKEMKDYLEHNLEKEELTDLDMDETYSETNDVVIEEVKNEENQYQLEVSDDADLEQLQAQLERLRQQNIEKEKTLQRQRLLNEIRAEQEKGKQLDMQIMDAKANQKR